MADTHPDIVAEAPTGLATLLVFHLAGERFALPVTTVAEVIDPVPATPVPHAAPHARLLVNVRGVITPVIDIRRRLRIPASAEAPATLRLVVIEVTLPVGPQRLAIEADAVENVLEVDTGALEPLPELGSRWPASLVKGVCRDAQGVVILLSPDAVFDPDTEAG
ncbi:MULTISPECIES: chemotaxis protein CheW [unclassified Rhodosalinus]|uniref:chemotaxis protein CheW n=1 Tax=unclassified Rhodosalinus TaxID=2630183 RepID=UPI0035250F1B